MAKNKTAGNLGISINGLDHVSIAVPDLEQAAKFYGEKLGCNVSDPSEVPKQGVRIAYVHLGNTKLELMEPLGHSSPIRKFLSKHPSGGIHHLCLSTNDIDETAHSVQEAGMNILGSDSPMAENHGKRLFFIHPKNTFGTLIEIEETIPS